MISQSELKEILEYDPDTGVFAWRSPSKYRLRQKGAVAGSVCAAGYVQIGIRGRRYYAHRLAWFYMKGAWPKNQIDHINRIRTDNRFFNLRDVTDQENKCNMPTYANNKSGIPGVRWRPNRKDWIVELRNKNQRHYIGVFREFSAAVEAKAAAVIRIRGGSSVNTAV